jgi:trk system potassium uptake protein TrkH
MRSLLGVLNVLGSLLAMFSVAYLIPIASGVLNGDRTLGSFLAGAGLNLGIGLVLYLATLRFRQELKPRDGYLLVTLGWTLTAAVATIPLRLILPGLTMTDAFFETMSDLSTTGATVLTGLDHLPPSINLWRATLCWVGGMGIIILAVAILPLLGVGGMQIYKAETPGPLKDSKLTPRIMQTARLLWLVYGGLTAGCVLALMAAGMRFFDALCHAFATVSLGGVSTHDASIGYYQSTAIEFVLIVFMLIAAMNFATHFLALRRGNARIYVRDPEVRWLLIAVLGSVLVLSIYLVQQNVYPDFETAFRYASFNVVSMATDCGFVSTDFGKWPLFAPMWMLFLSCLCANTGSTGGGIKMFRTMVLMKQAARELFTLIHPQAEVPLRISGTTIPNRIVFSVLAFLFLYFMTIVVLTLALLVTGLDFTSAVTAVIACINNTHPGLGVVGPGATFAPLTDAQTWLCSAAMLIGRLEVFSVLVLFTPAFWRR